MEAKKPNLGSETRRARSRKGIRLSSRSVRVELGPRLAVEAPGTLASLPFLSAVVQRFLVEGCGLESEAPETVRIRLAIQEAVTNVIRHAYAGREPGTVELRLAREADSIVVRLRDDGAPFDPRRTGVSRMPPPAALAEGGYGLAILEEVMNGLEYTAKAEGGNELVMRKKLS